MSRDKASLLDIVNAAKRVLKFTKGIDKSALATDEEKQSAILYQIIVIREATKRLSVEFRSQYPEVPWQDIAGMRDILAHQYDRLIESQYPLGCCSNRYSRTFSHTRTIASRVRRAS